METSTALAIFVGICVLIEVIGIIVRPDFLVKGDYNDDSRNFDSGFDFGFDNINDPTFGIACSDIPGNIYHSDDDDED